MMLLSHRTNIMDNTLAFIESLSLTDIIAVHDDMLTEGSKSEVKSTHAYFKLVTHPRCDD